MSQRNQKTNLTLEQTIIIGSLPVIFEGIYHGVEQETINASDIDNTLKLVLKAIKEAFLQ